MINLYDENSFDLLKSLIDKISSGEEVKETNLFQDFKTLVNKLDEAKKQEEEFKIRERQEQEEFIRKRNKKINDAYWKSYQEKNKQAAEDKTEIIPKASKYTLSQEKQVLAVSKDKILNKEFDVIVTTSKEVFESDYFKALSSNSLFVYDEQTIAKKIVKDDGTILIARQPLPSKNSFMQLLLIIEMRDCIKSLYALEKIDSPEIEKKRMELNVLYDNFIAHYGYLSLPKNTKLYCDDPAFELIKSLEKAEHCIEHSESNTSSKVEFFSSTAQKMREKIKYTKADVFTKRIFQEVIKVQSAHNVQEALITSFNQLGKVDINAIAEILAIEVDEVIKEIEKEKIAFYNPINDCYELAEYYLSGNVKQKLLEVDNVLKNNPSLEVNKNALLEVLPKDIDMADIAISLSSPWIFPFVLEDFINKTFGNGYGTIKLLFIKELGSWKITEFNLTSCHLHWGVNPNELKQIIKNMITQKPIIAYTKGGKTKPQIDTEKTTEWQAVAEKIHLKFIEWIWANPKIKQDLAKKYNDLYNTHVFPVYNSKNYELHGANPAIVLHKHQKDAVYRAIVEGTVLFDHVVGAGKTYVAIGSIIESKRIGKFKKPLVAVPNHLLDQWKTAFYELYPDCQILVVQTEDLTKDKVENLYYKIATSDYDAIIIKHSCITKFMIPTEFEISLLNEQVSAYKKAVGKAYEEYTKNIDENNGFSLKLTSLFNSMDSVARKIECNREYLTKKLKEDTKLIDLGDLKIDALVVDEAHEFKNLPFETNLSHIIGLGNPTGSFSAMDLFLKCRYIQETNKGKNVFFLTGTPITNSISEAFHIQRFMQYRELEAKGLNHFDVWASVFGRITTSISLDALGINYKYENRFDRFNNLPELMNMYRTFTDIITKNDLEEELLKNGQKSNIPKLKYGKAKESLSVRSNEQVEYMSVLVTRLENLTRDRRQDNILKIIGDARKASLDMRIVDDNALDFPYTKMNKCVEKVCEIWTKTILEKGTQLIFCDFSVPSKNPKLASTLNSVKPQTEEKESVSETVNAYLENDYTASSTFSIYEELRKKLLTFGIPQEEIAFIHDANTNSEKIKLFESVNKGLVRVLIGSTKKMGTGMNVQKRLVAAHHLDIPWRPSDLEQRNGRILRQGNIFTEKKSNFEVEIIYYITESMYDSRMWQILEYKTLAIEQFRKGDLFQRTMDEFQTDSITASEMKALATGNPLALEEITLRTKRMRLEALHLNYIKSHNDMEKRLEELKYSDSKLDFEEKTYKENIELRDSHTKTLTKNSKLQIIFEFISPTGEKFIKDDMEKVASIFNGALSSCSDSPSKYISLGKYRGFELKLQFQELAGMHYIQFFFVNQRNKFYSSDTLRFVYHQFMEGQMSLESLFLRFNNLLRTTFEKRIEKARETHEAEKKELEVISKEIHKEFLYTEELEQVRVDHETIVKEIEMCCR